MSVEGVEMHGSARWSEHRREQIDGPYGAFAEGCGHRGHALDEAHGGAELIDRARADDAPVRADDSASGCKKEGCEGCQ